jgi:hypothetical protein
VGRRVSEGEAEADPVPWGVPLRETVRVKEWLGLREPVRGTVWEMLQEGEPDWECVWLKDSVNKARPAPQR